MDQQVGVTLKVEIFQVHSKPFARARITYSPVGMVLVALHTGMRNSEQPNLQWSEKWILGGTWHSPMNQVVIEALQSLPRMLHNPFVFFGREEGQPSQWD